MRIEYWDYKIFIENIIIGIDTVVYHYNGNINILY